MRKFYIIVFEIINFFDFRYKFRPLAKILDKIKIFCLVRCGSKIGNNSRIGSKVFILNYSNFEIGENSSIEKNAEIFNYDKVIIGNNVEIGSQFYVNTSNHKFSNKDLPIAKQGTINKQIIIGSDIWIGARVTILSGTIIPDRVVIGAGSVVVSKKFDSKKIYAGNPAKEIKEIN